MQPLDAPATPPTVPAPPAFAWSADEFRRVAHRAVDLAADHLASIGDGPVFRPVPEALAAAFAADPIPRAGASADDVLARFARDVLPHPFGNGHPRFAAWVNSPPAPIGVIAELLAAAMNPSVAGGNHAAVHVERQVVRWFRELLGLPATAMGLLVSGGSMAALTALGVARHAACARRGIDVRADGVQRAPAPLVVYRGAEAHGCNVKAVELLGIGSAHLRAVPSDDALRMDPAALDALLDEDTAAGRIPLAVIASAGTVNTGAIDPIGAIADVCRRWGVWLHVDGAYGAPAILTDAYRAPLSEIARADSVALDPHKWMYVPVEAGLVLVRDGDAMRDAFSLVPPYLRSDGDEHGVQGPPWLSEYGVQQTRGFRALKVWMALRHFGVDGYAALVAHDLATAAHLADAVRRRDGFELFEPTSLSIVCFRLAPNGVAGDALDALNREALALVQLGGGAFLSSTVLGGRFWLRACVVNPRARPEDMDALLDLVADAGRAVGRTPLTRDVDDRQA